MDTLNNDDVIGRCYCSAEQAREAMRRALFMYGATESLEEKQRMAERPTTSDATRRLHAFRPIGESVATLKSLLEEKADPNGMKPLPPGHIISLQNVSLPRNVNASCAMNLCIMSFM